ncbi:MAG: LacI family DNA-binding transcriptional regulator [Bacillota bacterium]
MAKSKRVKRPTLREIAELAGVSHTTVSYVVNNIPKVSEETRQRVLAVMNQLGYFSAPRSRGAKKTRTNSVGYILPDLTSNFIAGVARGAVPVFDRLGITCFICDTGMNESLETRIVNRLLADGVDGIIFHLAAGRRGIQAALEAGIPLVTIEDPVSIPDASVIQVDNEAAAACLVEHLAALGHRRIGLVCLNADGLVNRQRIEGYREALARQGLNYEEDLVVSLYHFIRKSRPDWEWEPDFSMRVDAYEPIVSYFLGMNPRPTALICLDYRSTLILHKLFLRNGIGIPEQLSIAGFDLGPPVFTVTEFTTIIQPGFEIGTLAAQLLINMIEDPSFLPQKITMTARFVEGETTGPPPS